MSCSIVDSIKIAEAIWKPFSKRENYNPFHFYIKGFEELSSTAKTLSEIFPPYSSVWIIKELAIEDYFNKRLDIWNSEVSSGMVFNMQDAYIETKTQIRYIKKHYEVLCLGNTAIKKLIRNKVMANADVNSYLDSLRKIEKTD